MNTELLERAKQLAGRRYTVRIEEDETTDGHPIFLLSHPELPGCMAQGATVDEAQDHLADARLDYILTLLEDEVLVPSPASEATKTALAAGSTVMRWEARGTAAATDFLGDLSRAVRPAGRRLIGEATRQA